MQKFIVILVALMSSLSPAFSQMHTQCLDLFAKEPVPTEETAYRCLQNNPIGSRYTYVAIPWVVVLNHKNLISRIHCEKFDNGVTVCQHIFFRKLIPMMKSMGIKVLFTPHAVESEIAGIKIYPFPHFSNNGAPPAKHKDIWFSFIGRMTHKCRHPILKLAGITGAKITRINSPRNNKNYSNLLARSRFSLCPRGTGPSSIRFWESLQAGAIPVLISDEMRLPENYDWKKCVIRVPENQVLSIPQRLEKITPQEEQVMRQACLEAYEKFSGNNFTSIIHHYLK